MSHINKLIDYTVETFVVFENKVLLRFHDKYNIWLSVGGYIELNENPNEAAVREVKEEVGLEIVLSDKLRPVFECEDNYKELIPPYFLNMHKISDTHSHVSMTFFARSNTNDIIESKTEKSKGWKWMTKQDIEEAKDILPSIKYYALKALEELSTQKL